MLSIHVFAVLACEGNFFVRADLVGTGKQRTGTEVSFGGYCCAATSMIGLKITLDLSHIAEFGIVAVAVRLVL